MSWSGLAARDREHRAPSLEHGRDCAADRYRGPTDGGERATDPYLGGRDPRLPCEDPGARVSAEHADRVPANPDFDGEVRRAQRGIESREAAAWRAPERGSGGSESRQVDEHPVGRAAHGDRPPVHGDVEVDVDRERGLGTATLAHES
jgi:hypothetical protein